jgi:hypothetical protein
MFAAGKTAAVSGGGPDAQFNYVTMLLHGDGTNGAQNNTFVDSSSNNFSITRNGNATQGSFSPYGSNWSNYFDGNGDYLTAANNTALDVGTGAFTIEGWIYRDGTGDTDWRIVAGSVSSAGFFGGRNTLSLGFGRSAVAWDLESASNVYSLNTWTHVVYVRNGSGNLAIFANGTRVATTTNSNNYGLNGGLIEVGAEGANQYFGGYISNVRVVKGSAVYDPTASTLTVPTTPLTAVSGTGLLTCQSNRFIDNSSNNFTITRNGNTSVQRFNPFGASTAYSTSVIGGSGYFDGSGDYLSVANNTALQFGTGNFTFECWVYPKGTAGQEFIADFGASSASGWGLYDEGAGGNMQFRIGDVDRIAVNPLTVGAWSHVAVVRSGTTATLYVNGTSVGSYASASTNLTYSGTNYIGSQNGSSSYLDGYMSDVRVVKGTAVYTGNFTPPTAPLTAITNTSLLTNFSNGAIIDNAMMNDLETVGNAQISTSVKKFGTGSLYFDGTGDVCNIAHNPWMNFGSGNWTIEFWAYANNTNRADVISKGEASTYVPYLVQLNGGLIKVYLSDNGTGYSFSLTSSAGAYSTGNWVHVAVVRDGNTITIYSNGTSVGSGSYSGTPFAGNTQPLGIGGASDATQVLNGYIDDIRITKGYARYTATFTPPTAAFSDTGP